MKPTPWSGNEGGKDCISWEKNSFESLSRLWIGMYNWPKVLYISLCSILTFLFWVAIAFCLHCLKIAIEFFLYWNNAIFQRIFTNAWYWFALVFSSLQKVLTVATFNKNKFCKIICIRISQPSSGKQIPFHGFEKIESHLASYLVHQLEGIELQSLCNLANSGPNNIQYFNATGNSVRPIKSLIPSILLLLSLIMAIRMQKTSCWLNSNECFSNSTLVYSGKHSSSLRSPIKMFTQMTTLFNATQSISY